MNNLAIIIPYRDRKSHLDIFIPKIHEFLKDKNIEYRIFIIEQNNDKPFNRGKLLNIGYDLIKNEYTHFCFHDVDMIPLESDYNIENEIVHLASNVEQFGYRMPYPEYLGGVVIFPKEKFISINGYNNNYWGWGAEDDDLSERCKLENFEIKRKYGKYNSLIHSRNIHHSNYNNNTNLLEDFRKSKISYKEYGLNDLSYKLNDKIIKDEYIHFFVDL